MWCFCQNRTSGWSVSPFEVSGSLVDRGCSLRQAAWHQHLQSCEGAHLVRCYWRHSWSTRVQTRWRQSNHSIGDVLAESKSVKMDAMFVPGVFWWKLVFPLFWLNVILCWALLAGSGCMGRARNHCICLMALFFILYTSTHWQFSVVSSVSVLVNVLLLRATASITHRSSSTWFLCSNSTPLCSFSISPHCWKQKKVSHKKFSKDHVANTCTKQAKLRGSYMPSTDSNDLLIQYLMF